MKNTVSVLIPTLNEAENIELCLNCFLKQSEKPLEIIVVDNGSIDETRKIVKGLRKKFEKEGIPLRLFYHPHGNQTNARNFGVKKARGEIIGSLDAESCANEKWVEKIKEYFEDPKIAGIGGKSRFRNKGIITNFFYILNYYLRKVINLYCIGGGNSAFRKKIFKSVHGFEGLEKLRKKENILYAKDDYFLSKKLEQKGKLKFCPDLNVTLLYRIRDKQNKKYKKRYFLKEFFKRAVLEVVYDYRITKNIKNYLE